MAVDPATGSASLGAELRAAREARHLTLHKAAQEMHIGDDIIGMLEQDDYAALGAPIFVHGHLRNYARLLGLPPDEILAKYDHATNRLTPPPLVTQRSDASRFGRRVGLPAFSIVVIAVLVVLAVIWWQHRVPDSEPVANTHTSVSSASPPIPTPSSAGMTASTQLQSPTGGESLSMPTPSPNAKRQTIPPGLTGAVATRPPPAPLQAEAKAHAPGSYAVIEKGVAASQLVHAKFSVHQASWIEVYDAAGKRLYYSLAPAGDNIEVSGAGPLQVFLGNAPGVSIEYNGAAFNQAPFTQPNSNTARFTLGGNAGGAKPTG